MESKTYKIQFFLNEHGKLGATITDEDLSPGALAEELSDSAGEFVDVFFLDGTKDHCGLSDMNLSSILKVLRRTTRIVGG